MRELLACYFIVAVGFMCGYALHWTNIRKLRDRKERGVTTGSGDNR